MTPQEYTLNIHAQVSKFKTTNQNTKALWELKLKYTTIIFTAIIHYLSHITISTLTVKSKWSSVRFHIRSAYWIKVKAVKKGYAILPQFDWHAQAHNKISPPFHTTLSFKYQINARNMTKNGYVYIELNHRFIQVTAILNYVVEFWDASPSVYK